MIKTILLSFPLKLKVSEVLVAWGNKTDTLTAVKNA